MEDRLTVEQLQAIGRLDTCTTSNVIETFNLRLRNEGFADSSIRCVFPHLPPMIGYAVTGRISCSGPPPTGHTYFDRTDWWNYLLTIPAPRVIAIQDVDSKPGLGAFVGEVHASILGALGCVGVVTNGAVRDLGAVEPTGFHFFAGSVAVSHAYVHMIELGGTIDLGGLEIRPGDLLQGDRHGIINIPKEIAAEIPSTAARMLDQERKVIDLCRSPDFSLEKLRQAVKALG